jgi:hypothetical protein
MNEQVVDLMLRLSYVLIGAALLGIVIFGILQLVRGFRSSIPTIIGVIGLALIFFIMYGTTSSAEAQADFSAGMIQAASAGLMTSYALAFLALIGIVIGEIYSSLR